MPDETENGFDDASGTLADAIAAHLELKKEHGADPDEIEHELEDALAPPRRDEQPPAAPEPEPEPVAEVAAPPAPEPPAPEPVAVGAPTVEDGSEPDPDPISEQEVAASVEEPRPGEITGSIEFEFVDEAADQPAASAPEVAAPEPASGERDLLEDTPDFFEETPEHDKLWFDEAPPRKFDF